MKLEIYSLKEILEKNYIIKIIEEYNVDESKINYINSNQVYVNERLLTKKELKEIKKRAESVVNKWFTTDFKCKLNSDVENFLHKRSIELQRKNVSRTFLILDDEWNIHAYFTLAIHMFSNELKGNDREKFLNNVKDICRALKSKGILTVVDTVAAIGGEYFNAEEFGADIALGGSQKCFSAPPGITMLSVSDDAWKVIKNRKTPIASFYCNLSYWENCVEKRLFPYTMPSSDLMGFDTAVDNILAEGIENIIERHHKTAEFCRNELKKLGLKLYMEDSFSATVTAFYVPEGYTPMEFIKKLKDEYKIFIGGSYGEYADKILRIGHMGESAKPEYIERTVSAIKNILKK